NGGLPKDRARRRHYRCLLTRTEFRHVPLRKGSSSKCYTAPPADERRGKKGALARGIRIQPVFIFRESPSAGKSRRVVGGRMRRIRHQNRCALSKAAPQFREKSDLIRARCEALDHRLALFK